MDAVQSGQAGAVTPDGHEIGELVPLRRRRFVPRAEPVAMSANAPAIALEAFRADQDSVADQGLVDPYER